MPIFADSWESLLAFVVILLLSGIGNWIKQRKGGQPEPWGDEEGAPPAPPGRGTPTPPPAQPAEPAPVFDLERELRRMLGQEESPPAAPAPPPARREPPPVLVPTPVPVTGRQQTPAAPPPVRRVLFPAPAEELDQQEAPGFDLAPMNESAVAYERANAIDDAALAKLEAARARTDQPRAAVAGRPAPRMSPEVASVLAALRQPRTARQAVLASVILGPPKALES